MDQVRPELSSIPLREYFCLADGSSAALLTGAGRCDYWCAPGFDGPLRLAQVLDRDRGGSVGVSVRLGGPALAAWEGPTTILGISWAEGATMRCGLVDDGAGGSALCWLVRGRPGLAVDLELRAPTAAGAPFFQVEGGRARIARGGAPDGPSGPLAVVASQSIDLETGLRLAVPEGGLVVWLGLPREDGSLPPRLARCDRARSVAEAESALNEKAEAARAWIASLLRGEPLARALGRAPRWAAEATVRSLLTLWSLQDRRSGLLVASPLTSIPQWPGSARAWDYRYAWLRDCADAGIALARTGALEQAAAVALGLVRVMRADPARSAPVTRLNGEALPEEHILPYLSGYSGAVVRVGNAAAGQAQVDTLGEVARFAEVLDRFGACPQPLLDLVPDLAREAAQAWRVPDHGIWEVRGVPRHYVHSKVLAWAALESALRLAARGRIESSARAEWRAAQDAVSEAIRTRGTGVAGELTMTFDDRSADSSTLAAYLVGYGMGPPAEATLDFVTSHLQHEYLLARHHPERDGMADPCAPFLFPSLWAVIAEARLGRRRAAISRLRSILDLAGPAGQLSEVADPGSRLMLGNYPQVQSHAALLEAILTLWGGPEQT
ncbi:MAG: glycoside hydrolase family 15 protein [Candidatus Dormibacteraeota bacterium]|nr:glycoside hydrolase family 15 protein [Candidatus Dormibacteraeota bacterium]